MFAVVRARVGAISMTELLEQQELLLKLLDTNALAQRIAEILALRLREADPPAEPPLSIDQFCRSRSISRGSYYALRRRGMGPQLTEIIVPGEPEINRGRGLRLVRISAESARTWDKQMQQMRTGEASELEAARAREQRVTAAKLAAQSPNHDSKNRARPVQRRPRR
jgi:hypothetical protein